VTDLTYQAALRVWTNVSHLLVLRTLDGGVGGSQTPRPLSPRPVPGRRLVATIPQNVGRGTILDLAQGGGLHGLGWQAQRVTLQAPTQVLPTTLCSGMDAHCPSQVWPSYLLPQDSPVDNPPHWPELPKPAITSWTAFQPTDALHTWPYR